MKLLVERAKLEVNDVLQKTASHESSTDEGAHNFVTNVIYEMPVIDR